MRTGIVGLICFIAGAVSGIAGTAAYLNKKHKKEENVVYIYKSTPEPKAEVKDEPADIPQQIRSEDALLNDALKAQPKPEYEELTSYARQYRSSTVREVAERLAQEESPSETESSRSKTGPKLIKAEEYGADSSLQQITLYLYSDGTLANEEEEAIEVDIWRRMIGDALDKFGFRDSNEQTIYVRNRKFGADFEIVKVHASYDP